MEYKVIHFSNKAQEDVGTFDSAYDAVDSILALAYRGEERAGSMYVIDSEGTAIFGPTDLFQMRAVAA